MKDLIATIFGTYVPVTYESFLTVIDSSTGAETSVLVDIIPNGLSGVDWPYVLGVIAFLVTLYCILRIIGSVISHV